MKTKILFFSLALLALVVSACGAATPIPATTTSIPTAVPPTTAPATAPAAVPVTGGAAAVNLSQAGALGSFLVDSKGMTLYMFKNDTTNTSNCSGTCANNWPPLLTNGAPTAGTGVNASLLGTITRSDGGTQVTYNGMPLYFFIADKAAGDTKGQAVKNVWYVVDASGNPVMTAPAASSSSGSSSSA